MQQDPVEQTDWVASPQLGFSSVVQFLGTAGAIWRSSMKPNNSQKNRVRKKFWSTSHFVSNAFSYQNLQENMSLHIQYCKVMAIILGFSCLIALTTFVLVIS